MSKPCIGITMGDPAGVGPELCLRALADPGVLDLCVPVVFGDSGVLRRVARVCNIPFAAEGVSRPEGFRGASVPTVVDCDGVAAERVVPGKDSVEGGKAAHTYIAAAVHAAREGRVAALSTAPISKRSLHLAGIDFPGHTEMLAAMTGTQRFCMMMASDKIIVSLVTTHVGYADVVRHLSTARVLEVVELTLGALRHLGNDAPTLAVCGLNPHGGEQGLFGDEEERVIEPAVVEARARGVNVLGVLPPDTAFVAARRRQVDAYIVMYHDQGLIPFKMLAFEKGVNITLGLPIVRTSADHGTAFDIAWTGKASAESLIESVRWAVRLSACH